VTFGIKFAQTVETGSLTQIVQDVFDRGEVIELVDIVLDAKLPWDGIGHKAAGNTQPGQIGGARVTEFFNALLEARPESH
jgi:hypothetical protein